MLDLTPGVRVGRTTMCTADDAAAHAIGLAEEAAMQGSFGVGGFLLDQAGNVIVEALNAVVRDGHVVDPTAHVERQLIDWLCGARHRGFSTSANDLTIVCSVEPCAMCAGAILRAGVSVIAVAEDKLSGVHHAGNPYLMPHELWDAAAKQMALFGVRGLRLSTRSASGFASDISPDLLHRAEEVFLASVEPVNRLIADQDFDSNSRHDQVMDSVHAAVCKASEGLGAGIYQGSIGLNVHKRGSRAEVTNLLTGDGSVLVDGFGNVIVAAVGGESERAARTSVLGLVRAYTVIRNIARNKSGVALPNQRYCSIVKQTEHFEPAKALLEFGALGSFFAAPRKSKMLPAIGYLDGTSLVQAKEFAASLPPFYTSIVGIDVGLIPPPVS